MAWDLHVWTGVTYALTLEHPTQAPITIRGTIDDSDPEKAMRRALREAEKGYPRFGWSSMSLFVDKAGK